jgi:hypothetical protein
MPQNANPFIDIIKHLRTGLARSGSQDAAQRLHHAPAERHGGCQEQRPQARCVEPLADQLCRRDKNRHGPGPNAIDDRSALPIAQVAGQQVRPTAASLDQVP